MLQPILQTLNNMRVILATGSKQRHDILAKTPLQFEVQTSNFEENLDVSKHSFSEYVELTALGKVQSVYKKLENDPRKPDLIIGLDTMVYCEGKLYGKPKTKEDAIDVIRKLTTGPPHVVCTGVVLMYKGMIVKFTEETKVYMEKLSDEEILAYVKTGEPLGKAGGYAIQGLASSFIRKIEGDYNNVIGLPLCRITNELKKLIL